MTVELNKDAAAAASSSEEPAPSYGAATTPTSTSTDSPQAMDDEERIALQMIEELLGRSSPVDHLHGLLHGEEGSLVI
uniref:Uncharacterized protein n=1 Tax=Arundo donax TaxID=35708 RepID=A0A0A9D7A5_ARUDO